MKHRRKILWSTLLSLIMVFSMFAIVPLSASAAIGDVLSEDDYLTFTAETAGSTDYLTFTAETAGSTVKLNVQYGSNFQYDLNDAGLTEYTPGTVITLANVGDYVRFSGKDTKFDYNNHFSITGKVACSGNVMSLRLDDDGTVQGLAENCFQYMFYNCTNLTQAPKLPETELVDYCYWQMFSYCTNLTKAPELPATNLAAHCYDGMFKGCTSLTELPELPATNLAASCYKQMFQSCTSLTKAPELPATNLAESCYERMFYGCTSLTELPELPATTLAANCYTYMFNGCTSLTELPELPATTLEYACYSGMFYGCTSLTELPELPATTLAANCYYYMFKGCSKIRISDEAGTFDGITYSDEYRIPYVGEGTSARDALYNMFNGTGGKFTGTPNINTTYYVATPAVPVTYNVTITLGSNMTKTTDSGAASQTGVTGAITDVVYTANDGYYFPENYSVDAVNGISVTRDSYTQITVAGTPTADAEITLIAATEKTTPDAPTTAAAVNCTTTDNNDGKLTGVTTEMEYKESNAASWTDGTGSDITGLVPGTYYVRIKATDTTLASANQELTIAQYVAPTYTVTWKNWDGTVLWEDDVAEGETPAYNGEDPVKPGNAQFDYIFKGWNPEVTAVAGDAVYTATFDETVHQHTFGTEDPRWSWSFVDGKCYANATYTCTCGEVEEVQATVDDGTVNNDNKTITYTATDKYCKTDSREFHLTYVVTYNGTSENYNYGDICKLTADRLSDWKVNDILRAEGAKTFYFPVTVDAEVTSEESASEEQKGIINVLSMDNTTNSLTYVVSWSLPEGAKVKSTMIYRCRDDSHVFTTADALLAASNLRSYNMKLNARNGQFTYKATKLTSGSYQTIMAQVVYTLNGETYTINTAELDGTQSIRIG